MAQVVIPANGWRPRPHQRALWAYLERGGKRAVEIAHRRWGKDEVALHWAAVSSMLRVGGIFHMLPEYAQARKAIWTAVNPHTGRRRIDEVFPHEIRENTNDHEMFIRFKNGSTWQVVGSDNYDRLVGVSVAGIVFSEWALSSPAAWAYLAPVVAENNGYALFITTPRGNNHAKKTLEMARTRDSWFHEVSTVLDTNAISLDVVEEQRLEYQSIYGEDAGNSLIQQEYYCSFEAAILGAYYAREMERMDREGRIGVFPPWPNTPVNTAWDLGVSRGSNTMAVLDWQIIPTDTGKSEIRILNYDTASGYGIPWFAARARDRRRQWLAELRLADPDAELPQGIDYVPHDARTPEMTSSGKDGKAKQRIEVMIEQGMKPKIVPNHHVADGISAVRQIFPRVRINEPGCGVFPDALREYQAEWDDDLKKFKDTPLANWAAHPADAKRYLAMAFRELTRNAQPEPDRVLVVGDSIPEGFKGVTLEDMWKASKKRGQRRI